MKPKYLIPLLLLLCAAGFGYHSYMNVDLTGKPYSEIEAYIAEYPNKNISYTVTIEGGDIPLELTNETTEVLLTSLDKTDSLITHADYLQHLKHIGFVDCVMDADTIARICTAFPNADISYPSLSLLGEAYPSDTQTISLPALTVAQLQQAAKELPLFPKLEAVSVQSPNSSVYTAADAAILAAALPDVTVHMTFDLFGTEVSTDLETLEYFKADIGGDSGLDVIRSVMPIMDKLTYLKLDWCGTTDEATAQLREELAPQTKVVWRIFFGNNNALTDTLKIWGTGTTAEKNVSLKYCNEVKYLDLGHNRITNCEWASFMPNLEVVIMGDCPLESIEPLRSCPKITYLEIFTTNVTDLSPLADLKNLQYLNISNMKIDDISPLYGLDNMVKINSTMNHIPQEQIDEYHTLQPQCKANFFTQGDPTGFGWRFENGDLAPRYALLREQFGYLRKDMSCYPKGYVTEEITYESTGITPPEL